MTGEVSNNSRPMRIEGPEVVLVKVTVTATA